VNFLAALISKSTFVATGSKIVYINSEQSTGSFTFDAEGSSNPSSPFFYGKLAHPSNQSGVTIGAGYDMGGRTEAQVRADLIAAGTSVDLAGKLAKGAGLTGTPAQTFVDTNRPTLLINDMQVLRSLFAKIYPGYVTRANAAFDFHAKTFTTLMPTYGLKYKNAVFFDWESLYPAIRVIAIDLVYQGFGSQQAGYGKPLHFCMANDFDWLVDYIRSSSLNQYEQGRGRAKYLLSRKDSEIAHYSQSTETSEVVP